MTANRISPDSDRTWLTGHDPVFDVEYIPTKGGEVHYNPWFPLALRFLGLHMLRLLVSSLRLFIVTVYSGYVVVIAMVGVVIAVVFGMSCRCWCSFNFYLSFVSLSSFSATVLRLSWMSLFVLLVFPMLALCFKAVATLYDKVWRLAADGLGVGRRRGVWAWIWVAVVGSVDLSVG
ncbi:hypothetical protein Tco_0710731 [Tanacetum coccineum]